MPTLDEKQRDTAHELVWDAIFLRPGQDALWNLAGTVGSGKTTVLRRVAEQLRFERLIPLTISAPAGEIDSGSIAMLETASQLKDSNLLNGEMSVISDPKAHWRDKLEAIANAVERHHEQIVILCDEP